MTKKEELLRFHLCRTARKLYEEKVAAGVIGDELEGYERRMYQYIAMTMPHPEQVIAA